jgi:hypothetical protein
MSASPEHIQEEFTNWTQNFKGYVDIVISHEIKGIKKHIDEQTDILDNKIELLREDTREAFKTYKQYTDDKFSELKEDIQDLRGYVDGKFNRMELMLAALTRHFHLDLPTEEK